MTTTMVSTNDQAVAARMAAFAEQVAALSAGQAECLAEAWEEWSEAHPSLTRVRFATLDRLCAAAPDALRADAWSTAFEALHERVGTMSAARENALRELLSCTALGLAAGGYADPAHVEMLTGPWHAAVIRPA